MSRKRTRCMERMKISPPGLFNLSVLRPTLSTFLMGRKSFMAQSSNYGNINGWRQMGQNESMDRLRWLKDAINNARPLCVSATYCVVNCTVTKYTYS